MDQISTQFGITREGFMKKTNIFGLVIAFWGIVETLLAFVILPFCKPMGEMVMRCNTTSFVDGVLGIFIIAAGAVIWQVPKTRTVLSSGAAVLGIIVALVPTLIVGVCPHPHMHCHAISAPVLVIVGASIAIVGAIGSIVLYKQSLRNLNK